MTNQESLDNYVAFLKKFIDVMRRTETPDKPITGYSLGVVETTEDIVSNLENLGIATQSKVVQ